MVTKKVVPPVREQLRERIRNVLESDNPSEFADGDVLSILQDVLAGLNDLDDGQVPDVFKQSPGGPRSVKPAEVKQLRIRAVAYIAMLRRRDKSLSLEDAIAEIAEAFQRGEDAVRKWRAAANKKMKTVDPDSLREQNYLMTLVGLDKSARMWGTAPSRDQIIKMAIKDGKRLKILQPNYGK
jgi:hypothetical protein